MSEKDPEILILVGSPREEGKSAKFAEALMEEFLKRQIKPTYYHIAKYPVAACYNCGYCTHTGDCHITNDPWGVLSRHMETADAMILVAPVHFAGPAAHLKAALDRCQMFWARKYLLHENVPKKRPAYLVEIGDGGDPFGTYPMEVVCTSALNCANLRIGTNVYSLIGKDYSLDRAPGVVADVIDGLGKELV